MPDEVATRRLEDTDELYASGASIAIYHEKAHGIQRVCHRLLHAHLSHRFDAAARSWRQHQSRVTRPHPSFLARPLLAHTASPPPSPFAATRDGTRGTCEACGSRRAAA